MNKPDAIHKTATIAFGAEFQPAMVNLPLSVVLNQADQDEVGCSQVTVLLAALDKYRERVEKWNNDSERAITLSTIWEIQTALQGEVTRRLSAACELLHDIRFDHLDSDRRREPLT